MLALSTLGVLLSIALVTVALLLIGLILLQKNRGAGLSGAFGGVGGHTAFGTKTGDFLTWVTVGLVSVFLLLSIAGNFAFEPQTIGTSKQPADVEDAGRPADAATPAAQTPVPSAAPATAGTPAQGGTPGAAGQNAAGGASSPAPPGGAAAPVSGPPAGEKPAESSGPAAGGG